MCGARLIQQFEVHVENMLECCAAQVVLYLSRVAARQTIGHLVHEVLQQARARAFNSVRMLWAGLACGCRPAVFIFRGLKHPPVICALPGGLAIHGQAGVPYICQDMLDQVTSLQIDQPDPSEVDEAGSPYSPSTPDGSTPRVRLFSHHACKQSYASPWCSHIVCSSQLPLVYDLFDSTCVFCLTNPEISPAA